MNLRDRFTSGSTARPAPTPTEAPKRQKTTEPRNAEAGGRGSERREAHHKLKSRIHRRMVERLNLASLEVFDPDMVHQMIGPIVSELLEEERIPLTESERARLEQEVVNETFGLGPIEPMLHDPDVSDILVNTHDQVYVERFGVLETTDVQFDDDDHLMKFIDRIVSRVGRRVDESSPMVDARLPDGSRVNAIIPPLALDGPILSIRRFGGRTLTMTDLMANDSINPGMVAILQAAVHARLNMLIAGGTGSGKTTLLNALSESIPDSERIVTIEDAAELRLLQPHVVRLETRPPNIEGKGQVTQRELLRNALRMRPDRIVVGEVRGDEVLDMLQAMNTGHDGSITTVHANNPRDALHRLETLMLLSGVALPTAAMRQQISSGLDVIVHVTRLSDGTRRVVSVTEIVGMEKDVVASQEIFRYRRTGVNEQGRVQGHYEATGIRPKFAERLLTSGIELDADIFLGQSVQ